MPRSKIKIKSPEAAIRHVASLSKSGDSEKLQDFIRRAYRKFPESEALAKLWYLACRDSGDFYAAAKACAEFLRDGNHVTLAVEWLTVILFNLTRYDESLLQAFDAVPEPIGLEFKVRIYLACGDAVEALRLFQLLRRKWGKQSSYSYLAFANELHLLKLYEQAEGMYWKAIELSPDEPALVRMLIENQLALGHWIFSEKIAEAKTLADQLLECFPDSPEAGFALALAWRAASRPDRAFPYMQRYLKLNPQHPKRSAFNFELAYVDGLSPEEVYKSRCEWSSDYMRQARVEGPPMHSDRDPERRLRVGYVSPDLGKHPVGYFCKAILPKHDPEGVEVFLYSARDPVSEDDELSQEFRRWVGESHWRWIHRWGHFLMLNQVRQDRIDVLVDLAGHSNMNRLDVFGNRGAPVQVTWLGFPGSTGLSGMDYRISDSIVEPEGAADALSSEQIWRLPNGFHAINYSEELPEPSPPPCLKNGYITFGSFNNINKIGEETCVLWARVLREIPEARILLKHTTMEIFTNRESLRSLFAMYGVDPSRLRFLGTTKKRDDHFKHYEMLDVALDPVGYNGTTTTCDALYMGVPVLTRLGSSHASRVSASLLHRMGMDGWVAKDDETFVKIAKAAAARPDALAKRRASMRATYKSSVLNDGALIARDLEAAYRQMWQIKCAEKIAD